MPNPQNIKPTKPGEIRNPKGKPVGTLNRKTLIKRWLTVEQDAKNPLTKELEKLSQADLMTLALIKKAREGDVSAYKTLMEWGTDDTQAEEQKITVEFVEAKKDDANK